MNPTRALKWLAVAAVIFGVLTVFSGGRALFGSDEVRAALGNIVPFVLWFNFLAGFVYVLAGVGLLRGKRWAAAVALFLAVATLLVFVAFGVYALAGGAFEMRTVGAMSIRSAFWLGLALLARHRLTASSPGSQAQ